jgi:hypothetical protein
MCGKQRKSPSKPVSVSPEYEAQKTFLQSVQYLAVAVSKFHVWCRVYIHQNIRTNHCQFLCLAVTVEESECFVFWRVVPHLMTCKCNDMWQQKTEILQETSAKRFRSSAQNKSDRPLTVFWNLSKQV